MVTLALLGDTMLGRGVAERLATHQPRALFGDALLERVAAADGTILNLECCVSDRGLPWPGRVFHFRAPPRAVEALHLLNTRCVTLANNHTLDYGDDALLDTLDHLAAAGIAAAGAGADLAAAREPARVSLGDLDLSIVSVSDDPPEYAATDDHPGIALIDPHDLTPPWLMSTLSREGASGRTVLLSPHWGPNMVPAPRRRAQRAASVLLVAGASLIAGTSAHVVHGVRGPVLFDLGDFIDDYATGPLRNDLGMAWLVTFAGATPARLEAVPLSLGFCHTDLARGDDLLDAAELLITACDALGTQMRRVDGRLVVDLVGWREPAVSPNRGRI